MRFVEATELSEKVPPHAWQEMIGLKRPLRSQRIHELEARLGSECHRHRNRVIQLHDGRRCHLPKRLIERDDAPPVRLRWGERPRVTGSNRSLQRVYALCAAEAFGAFQSGQTATDEKSVPVRTVLIEEQNRFSG